MTLGRVCSSSAYLLFVLRSAKSGGSGNQNAFKERLHSIPFSIAITHNEDAEERGSRRWLTLPPFVSTMDSIVLGKHLIVSSSNSPTPSPTTTLKWVAQCCPHRPHTHSEVVSSIHKSLDTLAAATLKYDYTEPPRLVHRLDKECSGILVMGRTHESATLLHFHNILV